MEKEMRRKDRKLTTEEAWTILEAGEYGILSSVSADGTPYGVPVSFACADGKIYIHGAKGKGHRYENLTRCPDVCFTVVGKTEVLPADFATKYESAIVFGKAVKLEDGEEKQKALAGLIKKYCEEFYSEGMEYVERAKEATEVFAILPESISGKARRK